VPLGVAGLVEQQLQLLELLPRQLSRALGDDEQRWDVVHVLPQVFAETLDVVLGLLGVAIATLDASELVGRSSGCSTPSSRH